MAANFQYKKSTKTKVLNLARALFRTPFFESFFIKKISTGNFIFKKMVPPEYLYKKNSIRNINWEGVQVELDISNVVDHEIYFGLYEKTFSNFLQKNKNVEMFWDIGANIGWTTIQFHKAFPQKKCFCFEPSANNRARLQKHIDTNHINATVVPFGLGSTENVFKLYSVVDHNPGMNRILNDVQDLPYEEIKVIKGDDYWIELGSPSIQCVKIDVEGFEMNVLAGLDKMITTNKPALFIEVDDNNLKENNSSAIQLLKWLQSKNYKLYYASNNESLNLENIPQHFDVIAL